MAKQFHLSPFGKAIHCWVNKPDTKYSEGKPGTFKVDLVLEGPDAEEFRAKVQLEAEAAMERFWESDKGKKIPQAKRKDYTLSVPCADDEDDQGNPTGFVLAKFKQNSVIRYKNSDGQLVEKAVKIGIKDTKDKLTSAQVFSGSELRVMYSFRDTFMESLKKVGTRLDFAQVQVRSLAAPGGGSGSFGETDGDFVGEDQDAADEEHKASGEPAAATNDGADF